MDRKNIPSISSHRPFIPIIPMDDSEKDPCICPHCWLTLSSLNCVLFEHSLEQIEDNGLFLSNLIVYFRYLNLKLEHYNKSDIKYLLHFEYNHQYICNMSIQDLFKQLKGRFVKCRPLKKDIPNETSVS